MMLRLGVSHANSGTLGAQLTRRQQSDMKKSR